MPPQSRIGPLALEAPLAARSHSGQVFRAIHVEQRKLLAVRVFPIPMGLTPESRRDYAAQIEELKQLRHDGIVRCYGGGFDARNAYLVYELVDGESLDKLLERRERLPWETALQYARALTDAVQYAHLMGWVHGAIRPEKLLVSAGDDAIKLNDFRRDAIASTIGGNVPSLEQLFFVAPEQLQPGYIADEKCDLYSIGAVLYTMLVGSPPLTASSSDELLRIAPTQAPASVHAKVFDCPVWLSAVIDQLLSKDPKQRPYSAAALQLAFKEAEKRQAEGASVLHHATSGFSPLKLKADRGEAEKVLGIQPKKVRKRSDSPLWERPIVLLSALAVCIGFLVWFMLPLGQKALRDRAERLMASEEWTDWDNADVYLVQLVERFPQTDDAEWAREQIDFIQMMEAERRLERNASRGRPPKTEAERRYLEGKQYEQFGDRASALDVYRGIVNILADDEQDQPIIHLARRQIRLIEEKPFDRDELKKLLLSKLEEADQLYRSSDVVSAKKIWESIVNLYRSNQETKPLVDQAQSKLDELKTK